MSDTITRMQAVFSQALELASRKNADYGDAWKDQGWRGNLSRVFEKAKRLRTILWRGEKVDMAVRENVRETAIDMMNTLAFFIINHDAGVEWGHEEPFPAGGYWALPTEPAVGNGLAFDTDGLGRVMVNTAAGEVQVTEVNTDLPVRVPGEELLGDTPPAPSPQPRGTKTGGTKRTMPPR